MQSEETRRDLGALIKQLDLALERHMNRSLSTSGLTRSQAFMLNALVWHGGQATLKELEADSGVAQSTSWGVVKRLEEKGLVRIEPDHNDARAKVARLTPQGRTECNNGRKSAQRLERHFRDVFSPEEHAQFETYLERMLEAVDSWEDCERSGHSADRNSIAGY